MSRDAEIYAAVILRLAQFDHGWKGYEFQALYVLDHAVPGVEDVYTNFDTPAREQTFDEALKSSLREKLLELPLLTFVPSFHDVYDPSRPRPNHVQGGGMFISVGPIAGDEHSAVVGAAFYGGPLWARWMRYHLERTEDGWGIASTEVLAVS
jgi:hypothetical protein